METKKQQRKVGVAGSFINQIMGNNSSAPSVGDGATILMYSDRHAYEVVSVSDDGNSCVIREMETKWVGQSYGDERYTYKSNPDYPTMTLEWNDKKNSWGSVSKSIQIIKSLQDKIINEHGYKGWRNHLPIDYSELTYTDDNYNMRLKLVKGVTKEYKTWSKVSIIFGVMEKYIDPSF